MESTEQTQRDAEQKQPDKKLWITRFGVEGSEGQSIRDLYDETYLHPKVSTERIHVDLGTELLEDTPDFPLSALKGEIHWILWNIGYEETHTKPVVVPYIVLEAVALPTGSVYSLYISNDKIPDSKPMEITEVADNREKTLLENMRSSLLEDLRLVNGQYTYDGYPIFYRENLPKSS